MPPKTLPSFASVISSGHESPGLPDYYRTTRREEYGPYHREPDHPQDLMKTIDYRGRDNPDSSLRYFLPDIFEEDETETKTELGDPESVGDNHTGDAEPAQGDGKPERMAWVWRLFTSLLRKYRRGKVQAAKNVSNVHFDLTN